MSNILRCGRRTGVSRADRASPPDRFAIWASAGLVVDPARPGLDAVAVLTLVPTTEDAPLTEVDLDILVSTLIVAGFEPVQRDNAASLSALPVVSGWRATVDDGGRVEVSDPDGEVYATGDLGEALPAGWLPAVRRRGLLVVVATRAVDLAQDERPDWRVAFRTRAPMAGAQVPVEGGIGVEPDAARPGAPARSQRPFS